MKLIKYFLTALTIPEKDLWVNLSPYEKDRMIAENLGKTQMGQDMLAQDYILKQLTASLIYPERDLGKAFWDKVYQKAQQLYGTTEIPVNTFNKVWIVADKADIFERGNVAYIVGAHLKVMLEEDYTALNKNQQGLSPPKSSIGGPEHGTSSGFPTKTFGNDSHAMASQIVREVILPSIEQEVNQGKNFAPLRQMFYSMILASWYKMALKDTILTQLYGNQSKTKVGINANNPNDKDKIFEQYLKAYKKGVFNYIKEDASAALSTGASTPSSRQSSGLGRSAQVPRKYFSGGLQMGVDQAMRVVHDLPLGTSLRTGNTFDVAILANTKLAGSDGAMVARIPVNYTNTRTRQAVAGLKLTELGVGYTRLSNGNPTPEMIFTVTTPSGRTIELTGASPAGESEGVRAALFMLDGSAAEDLTLIRDGVLKAVYGDISREDAENRMLKDIFGLDRQQALVQMKADLKGKNIKVALWIAEKVILPKLKDAIESGRVDPAIRYRMDDTQNKSIDDFLINLDIELFGREGYKGDQFLALSGGNVTALSRVGYRLVATLNGVSNEEVLSHGYNPDTGEVDPHQEFGIVHPMPVLIEGAAHGGWLTDFQEFMYLMMLNERERAMKGLAPKFESLLNKIQAVTVALTDILKKQGESVGVGSEAAFMLRNANSNLDPIQYLLDAARKSGLVVGEDYGLSFDWATSEIYHTTADGWPVTGYYLSLEGRLGKLPEIIIPGGTAEGQVRTLGQLITVQGKKYAVLSTINMFDWIKYLITRTNNPLPLATLEDIFAQFDIQGTRMLTGLLYELKRTSGFPFSFQNSNGVTQVMDDMWTTRRDIMRAAIKGTPLGEPLVIGEGRDQEVLNFPQDTFDGGLVKLNQVGPIKWFMQAAAELRARGRDVVDSHRGNEPANGTERAAEAIAITTFPVLTASGGHEVTGRKPIVAAKFGSLMQIRSIVWMEMLRAYERIDGRREADAAMLAPLRDGNYPAEQAAFNTEMDRLYGEELKAAFDDVRQDGKEYVLGPRAKSAVSNLVQYYHDNVGRNSREWQRNFYEWVQSHQSFLSANVIAEIGLETYAPFFLEKLQAIALENDPDGNPRAAARQIQEIAKEGMIGGYEVSGDIKQEAQRILVTHPNLSGLAEWLKEDPFPTVEEGSIPGYLLLVRHGETTWNETALNMWAGWLGAHVTERGRQQTLEVGSKMNKLTFQHAISSDLIRAIETMEYFLEGRGDTMPYETSSDLREKSYGFLAGFRRTDVARLFTRVKDLFTFWRREPDGRAPGGESFEDTKERVRHDLVHSILPRIARGENVVISAHGNSLRALIAALREFTLGRALTRQEVIDLEVPQSAPIGIIFDKLLKAKEFWSSEIGAEAVQEALLNSAADAAMAGKYKERKPDQAMATTPGGIDFNRAKMQMNVRKEGAGVQMQFDPAMIERIKREGFDGLDFKIDTIVPITNLPMLLGLRKEEQESRPPQLASV
ncbi:MAG: histidine phosphatase family protein [Candidatus Omnitrophota bacterium]|nr:histidine phosphatase family protein [Candidatus Omnitrophota bacterium]